MRYLHCVRSIDPRQGGVASAVRAFAATAARLGARPEIASLDPPDADYFDLPGVRVHGLGPVASIYGYRLRYGRWLRDRMGDYGACIVDGLWTYHALGFRRAWTHNRRPYLVFPHGMLDPWFRRTYPLKHLKKSLYWPYSEYRLLRDAHAVCFTAEEERRRALGCFRPYRLRSRIVSLGIPDPPSPTDKQARAFAAACPAATGKRVLLFLARIDPKKGCDLLLRAFAGQARGRDELHLVMAGPDLAHRQGDYMTLARELGIADQISWPGMLAGDAKWGALHAAEAMCLTSHQENFGVGLAEALACGTPVLLSDQIAIWREPIAAGAGFAAPDTQAGAEGVLARWLALEAQERAAMAAAARELFAERYRIETATSNLLTLLTQAADRGGG